MGGIGILTAFILSTLGVVAAILALIYVVVPLFKGIGWMIGGGFRGIGMLAAHVINYIGGTLGDALRFVGALLAMVFLLPMAPLNVIIGRWSAAGHFADAVRREFKVAVLCVYRVALQRPLRLLFLHGLLEGLEQRVPEVMAGAPTSDKPSKRTGQFDGFTIVGSLRGGGSGGKLYIAQPDERRQVKRGMPDRVVIKSFAISDGSSLPQIVRESRALEAAKQLGLVLEHGMDPNRFWYVMPYHDGENLGTLTRQMHAESGERGLTRKQLSDVMVYARDLLGTLARYHRGGLWHKDVKPDNIIVHDGKAHLVDLGLVTPLRSAMTLTTHGTEYFRDPEMVRQALRGVKVHQVDGTKFDIYAAGAVLYFVLENTFPAHGGLSRFTRKSPEALRWIVRRAMAEYNKRYPSVDHVLADIATVLHAPDPFAVRPIDLPSMRGESIASFDEPGDVPAQEAVGYASAGTPRPPADAAPKAADEEDVLVKGFGLVAGIGSKGAFAKAGKFTLDADGNPIPVEPAAKSGPPPKLRVTNWWTGEYEVEPGSIAQPAAAPTAGNAGWEDLGSASREQRKHAQQFRRQVQQLREDVHRGAISPRQAARKQIQAARKRARDMQKRAQDRRHDVRSRVQAKAERQPSAALVAVTFLFVFGGIALAMLLVSAPWMKSYSDRAVEGFGAAPGAPSIVYNDEREDRGAPVLVINDHPHASDESVQRGAMRYISQRSADYHVFTDDVQGVNEIAPLIREWVKESQRSEYDPVDIELEDALERHAYYGVLYLSENNWSGVDETFIYSVREGAEQRRRPDVLTARGTLLLINDHPAAVSEEIDSKVRALVEQYQRQGWTVAEDSEAEAAARARIPLAGAIDATTQRAARLRSELADKGYDGLLLVEGDDDDEDNITHRDFYVSDKAPSAQTSIDGLEHGSLNMHIAGGDAIVEQRYDGKSKRVKNRSLQTSARMESRSGCGD